VINQLNKKTIQDYLINQHLLMKSKSLFNNLIVKQLGRNYFQIMQIS
jgi:hypothetical protein